MATNLQQKDNQGIYDDEFNSMVESGAMGEDPEKTLSPEKLQNAEETQAQKGEAWDYVSGDSDRNIADEDELDRLGNGFTGGESKSTAPRTLTKKQSGILGFFMVVILGGFGLLSMINFNVLDYILENIDTTVMPRMNASFNRKSDKWMAAYIKLRITEVNNPDYNGTLYFRADETDYNRPLVDWYRKLRASDFEKEMFNEQGIFFTSSVDTNGDFSKVRITIKDDQLEPFNELLGGRDPTPSNINDIINNTPDIDNYLDEKVFDTNKEARIDIRRKVRERTRFYQVVKRRHMRKDIMNMTGIGDWKFFEKTRNKIDARKIAVQKKVINKVFAGNGNMTKFMNCLFGGGKCPASQDMNHPDNKASVSTVSTGSENDTADDDTSQQPDGATDEGEDHTVSDADDAALADLGEEATEELAGTAGEEAAEELAEEATETATQLFMKNLIEKLTSGGPTSPGFWWDVAKKLTAIHNLFAKPEDGGMSKAQQMVYAARASQLAGSYATLYISRDQIRSGELVGDELPAFMSMFQGFQSSEAWSEIISKRPSNLVSAAAVNNVSKKEYCKEDYQRQFGQYAWNCDQFKPNGGGNANALTDAYNASVEPIIAPIANSVNGIRSNPITSGFTDFLTGVTDTLGSIVSPVVQGAISGLGLEGTIEEVVGYLMGKLMGFMGVAPNFDGSQPGVANFALGGGAVTAETGARAAGGVLQTPATRVASNQLASNYMHGERESQSIMDRYASLETNSLLAKSIYERDTIASVLKSGDILGSLFRNFGSVFQGVVFADNVDYSAPAEQMGVDRYDITENCANSDPLTTTLLGGTNYDEVTGDTDISWEDVRDSDKFYEKLYSWAGEDTGKLNEALTVWNCHLLDARVAGSLGFTSGYTDDGGLGATIAEEGSTGSITVPEGAVTEADTALSTGCGGIRVHKDIVGVLDEMCTAAEADGISLTATSGWRNPQEQIDLRIQNCGTTDYDIYEKPADQCSPDTAIPGTSNHEGGIAIDFATIGECPASGADGKCADPNNANWVWLSENASRFGFEQLDSEAWHWSVGGG